MNVSEEDFCLKAQGFENYIFDLLIHETAATVHTTVRCSLKIPDLNSVNLGICNIPAVKKTRFIREKGF